jgi:hypothetical protein
MQNVAKFKVSRCPPLDFKGLIKQFFCHRRRAMCHMTSHSNIIFFTLPTANLRGELWSETGWLEVTHHRKKQKLEKRNSDFI